MNSTNRSKRESKLPAGIERTAVLSLLHDHESIVRLNPLVKSVDAMEAPAHASAEHKALPWKKVVDEISYLPAGMWKGDVEYEACFQDLVDGVHCFVWAAMGVTTNSRWSVSEAAEGGLLLTEDCETKCSFLLMPFVKKNQAEGHETMARNIIEKLGKDAQTAS